MSKDKTTTLLVGLDSHKDSISVANAPEGCADPPIFLGSIGTRPVDVDSVVRRLQSKAERLVLAFEARPCGYGLHRYLTAKRPARPCQLDPAVR
jgi:transposase